MNPEQQNLKAMQSEDNNISIDSVEIEFPLEEHTGNQLQNIR